ncbi:MAG: lytic polysaccharide monooxygenase [Actinomycetota bacterium]
MEDDPGIEGWRSVRRRSLALLVSVLVVVLPQLVGAGPSEAHGAPTEPGSRSYLCRVDAERPNGELRPDNPACVAAIAAGGEQQLWDWFGVLRPEGAGRTVGFVPDGQLCSGGNPAFKGLDLARADWPYTSLTAGEDITFRYNAWADHPGELRMYVTEDGYDPTRPLTWDDLENEPFSTYVQTEPNAVDVDNDSPAYAWSASLPDDKSGPHVIYSVWERSDSDETFYGCSDVRFDGGTGQVRHPVDHRTPASAGGDAIPVAAGLGAGYWSTDGDALVDANGDRVSIRGVNWFGFETANAMPHGLWTRSWEDLIDQIAELGFNTVRLPFSSALLEPGVTPDGLNEAENPDIVGMASLELMDAVIDRAGERGLKIILDRHALGPGDRHHLWWNEAYPPERLITDWELLAERYRGNPTVIGADLYNEPHAEACWGCGDPGRDWLMAATEAGNAIHAVNPGWLVFVEGVEEPDGENCDDRTPGDDCTWWGANLLDAGREPVVLDTADKVVYSPHEYATSVHRQPWFDEPAFPDNLPDVWDRYWGYLEQDGIAPVMVGELGTTLEAAEDEVWLRDLLAYLDANDIGFTYWSFNPNSGDTGGILLDDWRTVDRAKYSILEPYLLGPFDQTAPESPSTGADPPGRRCSVAVRIAAWDGAHLAHITVGNDGDTPFQAWELTWRVDEGERVRWAVGADLSTGGASNGGVSTGEVTATATPGAPDRGLAPGETVAFSFLAHNDDRVDEPLPDLRLNTTPCTTGDPS